MCDKYQSHISHFYKVMLFIYIQTARMYAVHELFHALCMIMYYNCM